MKTRFAWVILPPIIVTVGLFFYFFRWYKNPVSKVDINTVSGEESVATVFDPLGVKNMFPNLIGENLEFVICLYNRNNFYFNGERVDPNMLPKEFDGIKNTIGAMSVRSSLIPDFEIYKERGKHACTPIDMKKLTESKITSEINHGGLGVFYTTEKYSEQFINGKQIELSFKPAYVDISKTWLFARMRLSSLIFLLISIYIAWFGIVLLLNKIFEFIKGDKR